MVGGGKGNPMGRGRAQQCPRTPCGARCPGSVLRDSIAHSLGRSESGPTADRPQPRCHHMWCLECCCPWDSHQKSPKEAKLLTCDVMVTIIKAGSSSYISDLCFFLWKDQSQVNITCFGLLVTHVKKLYQDTLDTCWAIRRCL